MKFEIGCPDVWYRAAQPASLLFVREQLFPRMCFTAAAPGSSLKLSSWRLEAQQKELPQEVQRC